MLATNTPWALPLPPAAYPLLASPKIDGERALITAAGVFSRSGKPIPSPFVQQVLAHPLLRGLDGELTVGPPTAPDVRRSTAAIRRHSSAPLFGLLFHIFDRWDRGSEPFLRAHELLAATSWASASCSPVRLVPQQLILDEAELLAAEEAAVAAGWEGLILRSPHQPYKPGRCTFREFVPPGPGGMLKLKRRQDAEAIIIGAYPLQRNLNPLTTSPLGLAERSSAAAGKVTDSALLGSIEVRPLPDPGHSFALPFSIGAGVAGTWDEAERAALMRLHQAGALLGRRITYRYFPSGGKERPVQPQFVAFRP